MFLNSLLRFGAEPKQGEGWPTWDGAERKQAVLSVAFRYLDTYRELLQEEGDRSNSFPKVQISTQTPTHIHTHSPPHLREKHSTGFKCYSLQESISVTMATKLTQHCLCEVVIVLAAFSNSNFFSRRHRDQFCFPQTETIRTPGGSLIPQSAWLFAKVCSPILASS